MPLRHVSQDATPLSPCQPLRTPVLSAAVRAAAPFPAPPSTGGRGEAAHADPRFPPQHPAAGEQGGETLRMGREELRRSIRRVLGTLVSLGMGNRRERGAGFGLICPGTWRHLDAGRARGCLASYWTHGTPLRTGSLGAATTSVPLTLLFNCIFFRKT